MCALIADYAHEHRPAHGEQCIGCIWLDGVPRRSGLTFRPRVQCSGRATASRRAVSIRAQAAATALVKSAVPLKLEEGEMPINTYGNKAPFIGKIKSVQRIVGPKATGETCHIIIETNVSWRS